MSASYRKTLSIDMLKKKSSVRISVEGQTDKNIEVPTILVKHWKNILLTTLATVVVLVSCILYFATQKKAEDISSKYEATLDQVHEENKKLALSQDESKKNIIEAKKSFTKIDSTLEVINDKMRKRGLKEIPLPNAGGPVDESEENFETLSEYYEDILKDLDKKLSSLPIGIPHPGRITSRFGYRANPFTRRGREMHSGIDLKGRKGDPVKVTASGKVTFAGYEGQYGYVVKVKHNNGYETRYAHLSRTKVKRGQNVEAGHTIGLLGSTGRSTGPHLHYEILKYNKKLNPEKFFNL